MKKEKEEEILDEGERPVEQPAGQPAAVREPEQTAVRKEVNEQPDIESIAAALAQNEEFLNKHIYGNPVIKARIVAEYLEGLNFERAALISGNRGLISASPVRKANNLDEAAKLAEALFRK